MLVHGTTADHTRWTPALPALEERFTVYAVDRRGRGASGDVSEYALEREFDDVAVVVDSIDEALPNARIVVLDGQGHVAMNSAPALFVREVLEFTIALD